MSEDSEFYKELRDNSKKKRHSNEEQSIRMLNELGIKYEILSKSSSHYRVGRFNFWPTTGKFYDPKTNEKGRGIKNLIQTLNEQKRN